MEPLNDTQKASREQFQKQSDNYGKSHILSNVDDVIQALEGVPLSAEGEALDVATGGGHTAIYLASLGMQVIAADITPAASADLGLVPGLQVHFVVKATSVVVYPA